MRASKRISALFLLTAATSLGAAEVLAQAKEAGIPSPDTVLVEDGKVRVTVADFQGSMLRVPEDRRAGFRMSYERVAGVVDNVFIARSLAQKARDAGMDKDPAVQARLQQVQDAFLADLYSQKLEKEAKDFDLTVRARELYAADKDKYLTDEENHVQQILVSNVCHSNIEAREIARQAYDDVKAGKAEFLTLAQKYSDPGEKAHKGGDIGTGPVKRLVQPVRDALAKLKPGEISEPVESPFGYHVVKLIERKPAKQKPFDAVKGDIIAAERVTVERKRLEDAIHAVRNSKTVTTYRDNVAKLVAQGLDLNELSRKAREAQDAPKK